MAKQTFTTGQVLTAAQMTSLQQTAMGGGSATAKTANYVLVAADAGGTVAMNAAGATTITVNTALFAAGDTVLIQNLGAGTCTVTAGTATVNTAGSLALVQYESGILYFTATGAAIFNDYVQAGGGGTTFVGCKAYNSAGQNVSNATVTKIAFDTEYFDTDAIHDTSTNNTRFTVPAGKAGKWQIAITIGYGDNSSGFRQIRVLKNNSTFNAQVLPAVNGDETHFSHSDIFDLSVGDYMEVAAYQNSGGTLAVSGTNSTTFSFFFLGA